MSRLALLILASALVGCPSADDDDTAAPEPTPADDDDDATEEPPLEPTWTDVHPELEYRCTCHKTNEGGEGGMTGLENADLAYLLLVNQPSEDLPDMDRVEPGDPEASYLWLKVLDTHLAAGGRGDRMPPTGPGLQDRHLDLIREWIERGALND
jgi:hypothetical protein